MFEAIAFLVVMIISVGVVEEVAIPVGKAAIETGTELYDKAEDVVLSYTTDEAQD